LPSFHTFIFFISFSSTLVISFIVFVEYFYYIRLAFALAFSLSICHASCRSSTLSFSRPIFLRRLRRHADITPLFAAAAFHATILLDYFSLPALRDTIDASIIAIILR
jgi:hypothetical protein